MRNKQKELSYLKIEKAIKISHLLASNLVPYSWPARSLVSTVSATTSGVSVPIKDSLRRLSDITVSGLLK